MAPVYTVVYSIPFYKRGGAVGQQAPFDRFDTRRRVEFARHQARRLYARTFAGAQLHALHPQALTHRSATSLKVTAFFSAHDALGYEVCITGCA